ncbi:DnaD domain protein [Lactobacillus sp. YT155]|uniref:DnaD domain-containing protein n=1 Tax=Lactobacillus sp. YT155 TaxID=3060955 RepID=UPI00265E1E82|nr:DnaD domain protein [Lactobacillus sp. YT155]MDO1605436.1 DnaD domain protein [Lactobacillus sp. YT155]
MSEDFFKRFLTDGTTVISNTILKHLRQLNMTADEYLVYSELLMFQQQGNTFPSATELAEVISIDSNTVMMLIQSMIQKDFLEIKTTINNNHRQEDSYDLTPIYNILDIIQQDQNIEQQQQTKLDQTTNLFKMFEIELGRALSPIEQETIHSWINEDGYEVELIQLALKEAVLNQIYSLKYIDRILINWEKQNIKTAQQLEDYKKRNEF